MKLACDGKIDSYGFNRPERSSLEERSSQKEDRTSTNPKGGVVKVSLSLKPKHKQWMEEQDFGLSEWVQSHIDEEIEGETHTESESREGKKLSPPEEGSSPSTPLCDVCGEREGTMEIKRNGEKSYMCEECMEESSNPTCEMCEMTEAVKQVPMGSGRDKMWLCDTCMQEEGFRQVRKH